MSLPSYTVTFTINGVELTSKPLSLPIAATTMEALQKLMGDIIVTMQVAKT